MKPVHPPTGKMNLNPITIPTVIVDCKGKILAWYLPNIIPPHRIVSWYSKIPWVSNIYCQDDLNEASKLLETSFLKVKQKPKDPRWRNHGRYAVEGCDLGSGSITFSSGWFSQGHDVG